MKKELLLTTMILCFLMIPNAYAQNDYQIGIPISLVLLAFFFGYLAFNLSEDHGIIQILFLFIGIIIAMSTINILGRISDIAEQTNIAGVLYVMYDVVMWTLIIVLIYFLIFIAKKHIQSLLAQMKSKRSYQKK